MAFPVLSRTVSRRVLIRYCRRGAITAVIRHVSPPLDSPVRDSVEGATLDPRQIRCPPRCAGEPVQYTQRMTGSANDPKATLHRYLRTQRGALIAKLDGLGERDLRWPMTPTGTNLLGIVKHVASVQLGYFGEVFNRPADRALPWFDDGAETNADMWATAEETREEILQLHQESADHADATIAVLDLDTPGLVPWWPPDRRRVTLHQILVHVTVETARHAGHADIIRELIDGAAGNNDGNLPEQPAEDWRAYRTRLEEAAVQAAERTAQP